MKTVKQFKIEEADEGKGTFKIRFRYGKRFWLFTIWYKWYYYTEHIRDSYSIDKVYNSLSEAVDDIKYNFLEATITVED